jgi:hypothetical protein
MATPSLDHWLPAEVLAVSTVLPPWQKLRVPLMTGVVTFVWLTLNAAALAEQAPERTVTE